jgi:hypothetical protein
MSSRIALAPFLKDCAPVLTLGIRPCIHDYSPAERDLMRNAERIFFPTRRYVDVFEAASKPTFPSPSCHRYSRSRVLQAQLFQNLSWPAARTRLYFGSRQKKRILEDFEPPFDALTPDTRQPRLKRIEAPGDLEPILDTCSPLLIREVLPWEDRMRLISLHDECIAAQKWTAERDIIGWRPFTPCPEAGLARLLSLQRQLTRMASLDDIAIEWGFLGGRWHFIEMTPPPLHIQACGHTINRHAYICDVIARGDL